MGWDKLESSLLSRFKCQKITDDTLTKLLKKKECTDYHAFIKILEEVRRIKIKQGINTEHLMRQILSRTPAGINSILLQSLFNEDSRESFLGIAEKAAWVAFPEKVIRRVESGKLKDNEERKWY
ncbi:hypothetical protein ENBRE01_2684 [Enteropsectra breve]|nr:hypothetical protein ENBRE01_2684 [Enteropsectra breve]